MCEITAELGVGNFRTLLGIWFPLPRTHSQWRVVGAT